tara:strand:- start:69 stop:1412 length:1344 start_codon:yes stop_codon:yes gene_type:complete
MATNITQQLPPGYVSGIGEQFSNYFQGGYYGAENKHLGEDGEPLPFQETPISGSPFYADPTQMYGAAGASFDPTGPDANQNWYVAGQDPLTTTAQKIAQGTTSAPTTGLGSYQNYLNNANVMQNAATGLLGTTGPDGSFIPNAMAGATAMGNAADAANLGSLAAISGQGSANPYMTAAGTGLGTAAATTAGASNYQGANAYEQFMSPYQQQVMDATMSEYDTQAQEAQAALGASAGNAYGGGRFGVAQGQMAADQGSQRALLQAQLLNQGFSQAQGQANQAFGQQLNMGAQQAGQAAQQLGIGQQAMNQATGNVGLYGTAAGMQQNIGGAQQGLLGNQLGMYNQQGNQGLGLGSFGQQGMNNLMNTYTTMGQQNQLYNQAINDQQQALAQGIQLAPAQTMGNMGQFLSAAYGTPSSTVYQQTPNPSTLQTLLGAGIGLGGIMGAMKG